MNNTQDLLDVSLLNELSCMEHTVLGAIFHKQAGQPFSVMMSTAEWASIGLSRAEAITAFITLQQKGWIEAVLKTWGERLYYIPHSLLPLMTITYAERVGHFVQQKVDEVQGEITKNNSRSCHGIQVIREGKPDIAAELLHILAWMVREGQNQGLPLTGKGTVHKRIVKQLSRITVLDHEDFAGLDIHYNSMDVYPVHVAVIFDVLLSLGLIEKIHNRMYVSIDRLDHWLSLSWPSMQRVIYNICMDRYGAAEPVLQHFRYQLSLLAPGSNEWFAIATATPDSDWLKEGMDIKEKTRGWLDLLAAFGYGEVGETSEGRLYYRWLIEPVNLLDSGYDGAMDSGNQTFFVQPDFEIMVPPDIPPQVRWNLELISELASRDRMSIYRVTKERIIAAAVIGFTADAMVSFLGRYAGSGLPEHVNLAIQQWGKEAAHLHGDADQNTGLTDKVNEAKNMNGWIFDFRRELSEKLKRTERMQIAEESITGLELEKELFNVRGREGLIETGPDLHLYDQDESITEQSVLFPGYGEIPEVWHNQWRSYHMSTARQIAAKAIEWQTKLGLKLDKDVIYFIPDQIHGYEDWTLTGWHSSDIGVHPERLTFSPTEWSEIRLIIPEQAKT
ncbi:helicase-associated domain-containing protein [Paenibacillus sp. JNUCC31]|uniref:helicase-associated domain-containing protein n=1 Tax=Paenibacillus sp. JNUCC-31 TaxID=2777983 RepID=UPI001784D4E1|nr:helicase-associated domain-containing protein [Paenibacillus sp. JNUCC-31]QOS80120.1 helicase-associated domain-containing protein [Paenibacillus sp. JNUCC-31]